MDIKGYTWKPGNWLGGHCHKLRQTGAQTIKKTSGNRDEFTRFSKEIMLTVTSLLSILS